MKQLASNYSISGSSVTLTGVNVPLSQILLVSNASTGAVLYSMAGPSAASYTQGSNSVITLASAPGASDKLTIYYDDGVAPASSTNLSNIDADLGATSDAAATSDTGTFSLIALTKRLLGKIPALVSGRIPVDGSGVTQPISTPFSSLSYSQAGAISINTILIGPVDCSQHRTISIYAASLGSSGVLTTELSWDNVNWVGGLSTSIVASPSQPSPSITATPAIYNCPTWGASFFRIRLSSATTAGTTTVFVTAIKEVYPSHYQTIAGSSFNLSTTIAYAGGSSVSSSNSSGSSSRSLGAYLNSGVVNTDYNAVTQGTWSVNGTKTGGTTVSDTTGGGASTSFLVNVTAYTAGSSTGTDLWIQESSDNGTTWQDVWQLPRITATGTFAVPALPLAGRRRIAYLHNGAVPTAMTTTVTATNLSISTPRNVQVYDRTANVLNGTLNATTGAAWIAGCSKISARITIGSATTPAAYQIQVSSDGVNYANVGSPTNAIASSSIHFSVSDIAANWARVIVSSAATGQTGTVVSISSNQ